MKKIIEPIDVLSVCAILIFAAIAPALYNAGIIGRTPKVGDLYIPTDTNPFTGGETNVVIGVEHGWVAFYNKEHQTKYSKIKDFRLDYVYVGKTTQ